MASNESPEWRNLAGMLEAIQFAAVKHRDQRRKDVAASPYINHPIAVAELLARVGGIDDVAVLQAAVLHDTLEDTETTAAELDERFGEAVRRMVEEVTDDRALSKKERKLKQVEHAPHMSKGAQCIKVADKICNVGDVTVSEPEAWSPGLRREYVEWSAKVVAGCGGCNAALEAHFARLLEAKRRSFAGGS